MAYEILMPRLGWTMEEGVFVEWLKRDGDTVNVGDLVCVVEGDKAANEIEAFESGTLRIPPDAPPPGKKIKVGTLLGYIVKQGEQLPTAKDQAPKTKDQTVATDAQLPITNHPSQISNPKSSITISPRARRIAAELGVDWTMLKGSGRTGRIVERDVRAAFAQRATAEVATPVEKASELRISPLARKRAEELGVNVQALAATGKRIEVADVEAAARPSATSNLSVSKDSILSVSKDATPVQDAGVPMSNVRRLIAERMATSAHTTAAVTLTTEADATELVKLRKAIADDVGAIQESPLRESPLPLPSYNDLLAKLVSVALREHPTLNATLTGDAIVQHATVHVGIAVDTERGLIVPVVRDVQRKSVQEIAVESARLIEQVRNHKISADDLRGGTFTITNLGMYDIDAFTPIINLPECAILGVGRIVAKQVVVDEEAETVAIRKLVALSLTFDHRLVDGGPAARFLKRVKQFIERPYLWLTR